MKMKPIIYTESYSDGMHGDDDTREYFKPYRKESGEFVTEMICDISFEFYGFNLDTPLLVLRIYEVIDGQKHKVHTAQVYCYHPSKFDVKEKDPYTKYYIIPTDEQEQLITALCVGDLRGRYAENIVCSLYQDLFLLNPKSGVKKFLPEVVEQTEERCKYYGITMKSR